jgi:hypothetical protein
MTLIQMTHFQPNHPMKEATPCARAAMDSAIVP